MEEKYQNMDNNDVIKISINENEHIVSLLKRMLTIKQENNKDVECEFNNHILSTNGCDNLSDLIIANDPIIFQELENERNTLLNTETMQNVFNTFKGRGKKYSVEEENAKENASRIWTKEKEFEKKIAELDSLNYANPVDVYNWLNSTVEYINDPDLYLPTGLDKIEYGTMARYIVKTLEKNGYTNDLGYINSMDDHYRRLIAYDLDDLDKYNFFAYNYASNLRDRKIITDEEVKASTQENEKTDDIGQSNIGLEQLMQRQSVLQRELKVLDKIKLGELSKSDNGISNTLSFDERENQVRGKLETLLSHSEIDASRKQQLINNLQEELKKIQEQKEIIVNDVNEKISKRIEELENIEKNIKQIQEKPAEKLAEAEAEINTENNTNNTVDSNLGTTNENLPGSSAPDKMLPINKLEDDYYKRLENAANEGPIFHDNETDFTVTPIDKTPHIIKKITKAPLKLINKVKETKFGKLIARGLEFIKKHKKGAVIATAAILASLGIGKLLSNDGSDLPVQENIATTANSIAGAGKELESIAIKQENNNVIISGASTVAPIIEEIQNKDNFNKELGNVLNNILDGESRVYTSSDNAINNTNGKLPTDNQLENSWANATPGAYYNMENNSLQRLTEEEANNYWKDGGTVAVRMDNDGTPIGFVPVEHQEDTSSKGM